MSESKERKPTRGSAPRPVPTDPLKEALRVAQALKEFNAGNAWGPEDLAQVLSLGVKANKFYYLSASSRDYGLTTGTSRAAEIALTQLGREIVYAPGPLAERRALERAFLNVDVFKQAFEYYQGQQLPEMRYLANTLEATFGVPPEFHEDFYTLYKQNLAYIASICDVFTPIPNGNTPQKLSDTSAIVLGSPQQQTQLVAFVAIPFSEKAGNYAQGFFQEVLASLVTPAGVAAGFKVETARRQGSDIIHSTIINQLLDADLAIIDLTDHNPNVLFELGVRMAHDKPIAIIRAEGTGRIFDVDNLLRVYDYSPNLWKTSLERDIPALTEHIKASWDARDSNQSYMKILRKGT
jgi:hypothetical protein